MPNYDGKFQITILYSTTPVGLQPMQHTHTFDVALVGTPAVGTDWSDIDALAKNGTTIDLDTWMDTVYMPLLRPLFPASTEFQYAVLDNIPEGTYVATAISNHILGVVGTGAGASVAAQQSIFTFNSLAGGLAKMVLMETFNTSLVRDPYPLSGGSYGAYANYLVGATSIVLARDNSYLNLVIAHNPGQNEALFKKRYRL